MFDGFVACCLRRWCGALLLRRGCSWLLLYSYMGVEWAWYEFGRTVMHSGRIEQTCEMHQPTQAKSKSVSKSVRVCGAVFMSSQFVY